MTISIMPLSHRIILLCLAIFILKAAPLSAQAPVMEAYVRQARTSNLALQRQHLAYDQALAALQEAKGLYKPQVAFIANYTLAGGGRTLDFPIGDLLNPVYSTLNQLTETNDFPTDLENVNEQFLPNNFQETKIRIVQPLLNTDIVLNQRIKQLEVAMQDQSRAAYERELDKEVRTAYLGFLQSMEALKVYDEAEKLLRELRRVNQRLVDHDKSTPEILDQLAFSLSQIRQQKAQAVQQNRSAKAYFNFLLNAPLDAPVEVDSLAWQRLEALPGFDDLITQSGTRPELDQLQLSEQALAQAEQLSRLQLVPKINAVVDAGFQGFGYNFNEQGYWLGQVSLQWDLFQGNTNRAKARQAVLARQQIERQQTEVQQQFKLQVRTAYDQVAASRSSLQAAEDGLRSARSAYRLINKKYLQQQASWLELTQARTDLTQAALSLNLARYTLATHQVDLGYVAGL